MIFIISCKKLTNLTRKGFAKLEVLKKRFSKLGMLFSFETCFWSSGMLFNISCIMMFALSVACSLMMICCTLWSFLCCNLATANCSKSTPECTELLLIAPIQRAPPRITVLFSPNFELIAQPCVYDGNTPTELSPPSNHFSNYNIPFIFLRSNCNFSQRWLPRKSCESCCKEYNWQ